MEKLYTFGCSFTVGQFLPDNTESSVRKILFAKSVQFVTNGPSYYAWPSRLANTIGIPFENLALPGSSNIEIAARILDTNFTPQDLVVIMWTFKNRTSILKTAQLDAGRYVDRYVWERQIRDHSMEANAEFSLALLQTSVHHHFVHSGCQYLAATLEPNESIFPWNPMQVLDCSKANGFWLKDLAADDQHPGIRSHIQIGKFLYKQLFK